MGEVIQFPRPRRAHRGALTSRQLKALQFIEAYRLARGRYPSMEALCTKLGLRSLSGAKRIFLSLVEAGALPGKGGE